MYMKDGHRTMMLSFNPISQDITAKSVTGPLCGCHILSDI